MMMIRMLQGTVYGTGPVVNSHKLFHDGPTNISIHISSDQSLQIHLKGYRKRDAYNNFQDALL